MTTPLATWVGDQSYLATTPYLTPREYRSSPAALDPAELLPAGTTQQQAAALATVIARASAEADRICRQVLGATAHTEDGYATVRRDGRAVFPTRSFPILEVTAVSVGQGYGALTALADGSRFRIGRQSIEIPVAGASAYVPGGPLPGYSAGGKVYMVTTYVAGFPHGTLAADVLNGATSIVVSNPLGIYGGTRLPIYDDTKSETVTAAAPPVGNVVTLAAPLAFAHTATDVVGVSALPPDVKDAVAQLVNARIRAAIDGAGGEASEKIGNYSVVYSDPDAAKVASAAAEMLAPYRRTGI